MSPISRGLPVTTLILTAQQTRSLARLAAGRPLALVEVAGHTFAVVLKPDFSIEAEYRLLSDGEVDPLDHKPPGPVQ
jgi:hypothetical protein